MVDAVTPGPGLVAQVTTGGVAVVVAGSGPTGGYITNPLTSTDQGVSPAEPLYVDSVASAGTAAGGTTFALQPGQSYFLIPGQTTVTSVNAASSGHKFSVVVF